jgi:metallophosphoesterase (TIGR00282 family)
LKKVRILFFGDIVGVPGCAMFQKHAPKLKREFNADAIIVNGENAAANGRGITPQVVESFKHNGALVITGGNHSFQKKEVYNYLVNNKDLLRPNNFPSVCPGTGVGIYNLDAETAISVINVEGQVFMRENLACPFKSVESALTYVKSRTNIVIIDMHAEATSEKAAMAWNFDGKVSAVIGTHTHVQTADERILPLGTAFITDAGMAGSYNSLIGMKKEPILQQMMTQMPTKYEVEQNGPYHICGVVIDVDAHTGKALSIERFRVIDDELKLAPSKEPEPYYKSK